MSRSLTVYVFKGDPPHTVLASEISPDDIHRGRGGAPGDFYVVRAGYAPQWNERGPFLEQYEKLASPGADDLEGYDSAAAAIDGLEPAEPPAAIATRDAFASSSSSSSSSSSTPAGMDIRAQVRELGSMLAEALELRDRLNSLADERADESQQLIARMDLLEGRFSEFEKARASDSPQLPAPAPAVNVEPASASSSSSSGAPQ